MIPIQDKHGIQRLIQQIPVIFIPAGDIILIGDLF
jgi:hypothetical protein